MNESFVEAVLDRMSTASLQFWINAGNPFAPRGTFRKKGRGARRERIQAAGRSHNYSPEVRLEIEGLTNWQRCQWAKAGYDVGALPQPVQAPPVVEEPSTLPSLKPFADGLAGVGPLDAFVAALNTLGSLKAMLRSGEWGTWHGILKQRDAAKAAGLL